jgi:hypothetical protein
MLESILVLLLYSTELMELFLLFFLNPKDPVFKVTLAVSDLQKSLNYWSNLLGMKIYEHDEKKQRALLGYADNQVNDLGKKELICYFEFGS